MSAPKRATAVKRKKTEQLWTHIEETSYIANMKIVPISRIILLDNTQNYYKCFLHSITRHGEWRWELKRDGESRELVYKSSSPLPAAPPARDVCCSVEFPSTLFTRLVLSDTEGENASYGWWWCFVVEGVGWLVGWFLGCGHRFQMYVAYTRRTRSSSPSLMPWYFTLLTACQKYVPLH